MLRHSSSECNNIGHHNGFLCSISCTIQWIKINPNVHVWHMFSTAINIRYWYWQSGTLMHEHTHCFIHRDCIVKSFQYNCKCVTRLSQSCQHDRVHITAAITGMCWETAINLSIECARWGCLRMCIYKWVIDGSSWKSINFTVCVCLCDGACVLVCNCPQYWFIANQFVINLLHSLYLYIEFTLYIQTPDVHIYASHISKQKIKSTDKKTNIKSENNILIINVCFSVQL